MTITAESLRQCLDYDPETGAFTWKVGRGRSKKGDRAGCLASKPDHFYKWVQIRLFGTLYSAHRLAWLHCYGEFPEGEIDHINQDATDNRISNLRATSHAENSKNLPMRSTNTSGVTGVYWEQRTLRWRAEVKVAGKKIRLGRFESLEDAAIKVAACRADAGFSPIHGLERQAA